MGSNGMNVNGPNSAPGANTRPVAANQVPQEEEIIIDFKSKDVNGDLRIDMNELITPELRAYLENGGQLPEGMSIADFAMSLQTAAQKYDTTGDGKLNIDEYTHYVRGDDVGGDGDSAVNAPTVPEYSEDGQNPRAEANQKAIEEMNALKAASQTQNDIHEGISNSVADNTRTIFAIKYGGYYHYAQLYVVDGEPVKPGTPEYKAVVDNLKNGAIQRADNAQERVLAETIDLGNGKIAHLASDDTIHEIASTFKTRGGGENTL